MLQLRVVTEWEATLQLRTVWDRAVISAESIALFPGVTVKAPQDSAGSRTVVVRGNAEHLPGAPRSSKSDLFLLLLFRILFCCVKVLVVLANRLGNVAVSTDVFGKLKGNTYKWSFHIVFL